MKQPKAPRILFVSTFPPRECGIATFTQDTTNAFDREYFPAIKSKILAINENGTSIYNYPRKVIMQINETEMEDYLNRANEINSCPEIKLVSIQHEYGLFGGDWGDYILPFMEIITKPVVVTMHTVLPEPEEKLLRITKAITEKAQGIIVMTKTMAQILETVYGVDRKKINIIPHGVHNIPFPSKSRAKEKLSLTGRTILSTFGMLNRDKGIEYAIEAMPEVIKKHPDALYLIIGATHPVVQREEGEVYRNKLKKMIHDMNLNNHVKFYNKYVTTPELIEFLKATDVYISPTLNPLQAVSGTISYALSCACPIIATKNQYAKDVLDEGRGILVDFENSKQIQKGLLDVLSDRKMRKEMGKNAYFYSRHMTFQNTAIAYFEVYNKLAKIKPRDHEKLPVINLGHIRTLTDIFGMIQFAKHTKPELLSGYCLDDNARALLGCVELYNRRKSAGTMDLIEIYFNFIKYVQKKDGHFRNFINYNKTVNNFDDESEDSFGRAIWCLGTMVNADKLPDEMQKDAKNIFLEAIRHIEKLESLRAIAFTIIGMSLFSEKKKDSEITELIIKLSNILIDKFKDQIKKTGDKHWAWFEDCLTYSNYKLSEALFRAFATTGKKEFREVAEQSINFLNSVTFENKNFFSPIGQDGWYFRNGVRSYFDQQPEDTSSAVEALVAAYEISGMPDYRDKAMLAFNWFLGKNHLNQMVYDENTGGCYDGLGKNSLNFNQGAESTLSYFLARLAIEKVMKSEL